MAMDIELRNQLGALTAQVQELTKQSKNLDGTLATALSNGAKSAGGLAAGTRAARVEMTMAEQVSTRIGRAWASQMFSLATGAVGVTALWQQVSSAIDAAKQKAEATAKGTSDYLSGTRTPGIPSAALGGVRSALRSSGRGLTLDEQTKSLKAYADAGGITTADAVGTLGSTLSQSILRGYDDPTAIAGQYGKLQKMGITNPQDVIAALNASGRLSELGSMKPAQARALSRQNVGAWAKSMSDIKDLPAEDRVQYANRFLAAETSKQQYDPQSLIAQNKQLVDAAQAAGVPADVIASARMGSLGMAASGIAGVMGPDEVFRRRSDILRAKALGAGFHLGTGPGFGGGAFGIMPSISAPRMLAAMYPGKTISQIEAEIDASFMPASINPTSTPEAPSAAEMAPTQPVVPPTHWSKSVPAARAPSAAARAPVMEVRVVGDSRPVPVNAGD
jgi:hypothetical protein